ncbi:hypothetical protein SAMN02745161_3045 [Halodesulfovibrio marinisediminis DSM 17456]|uniref:Uncharacterized protein n=1 Tax=Halodesulfovibrio marinisediminis DSM 17456 TaxID=1121457 RepID=A0A1N6IY90_9BACT|nr:hypothetical protein SAMN02745161_3045 [Halodesulfovibrio marinisediminis DSM 17456]
MHDSTDAELPTPKLITPEEEAYLKEVLESNSGAGNTSEQPDAFSDNNEELLLDENQAHDHIMEEEENSITPPPLLSFDDLDSEEATNAIFERIAQERRTQEAQSRVTSDNHEAFNSITENNEETPTWDDTPLTEAVSHLTLNSDKVSHPAEVIDSVFLPQIPKIISQLQETFEEASLLLEQESMSGILHTAERLQLQAQKYALREIDKMASCVARAAEAQDQKAVVNLMKELESTVVQTGKALRDVYKHSTDTTENL